mgnify:CR=1 FL=1
MEAKFVLNSHFRILTLDKHAKKIAHLSDDAEFHYFFSYFTPKIWKNLKIPGENVVLMGKNMGIHVRRYPRKVIFSESESGYIVDVVNI